jgi:large subunit ribosomal protein L25
MSSVFEFVAEPRSLSGTSAARSVRRKDRVPAILYGGTEAPLMITLSHNEVRKHLEHEAVYSHVLDISVGGNKEKAVLKAVQRHPAKPKILHLDFLRVIASEKIKMHVPIHFINEDKSVGAKQGGVVMHNMVDLEVMCLPENLPEFIEVDLKDLNVGESLHISQITAPKGVDFVALYHAGDHDSDVSVVTIIPPTVSDSGVA